MERIGSISGLCSGVVSSDQLKKQIGFDSARDQDILLESQVGSAGKLDIFFKPGFFVEARRG